MKITVRPAPSLDPRGPLLVQPAVLASRSASVKGRTILLLDNTQLVAGLPLYGSLFRWLAENLQQQHGAICRQASLDLLVGGKERLNALADELQRMNVHAVVLALCHAGVTQPSTMLAAELERRGMPCVLLCSDLGLPLAGSTASTYVPGLPLVLVKPASGDGGAETFGKPEAEVLAPLVVAGLTLSPNELRERFARLFRSSEAGTTERAEEIPLCSRVLTGTVDRNSESTVELDPGCFAVELYEKLCADDLCDGFPVIPPTKERVHAMLRYTDLSPEFPLVDACPPSGAAITVQALAVNAVMAGCRPDYFPILVAALQAMADPAYRLFQASITTHPAGNAIIVSGPLSKQAGINCGAGCLGPGFRANATIGRAITLTILNVARAIPGKSDLSVFGSAAEFTCCVAENCEANPWSPLHVDLYGQEVTSVTVVKCEGPHNVASPERERGPEAFLRAVGSTAATLGGSNMTLLGPLLVLLNPGYARMIADFNWTKRNVKEYLFEIARHPVEDVRQESARLLGFPAHFLSLKQVPVMRSADDVIVIVCGGMGRHSMVAVPWGLAGAASRPVTFKDGTPRRSLEPIAA